MLCFSPWASCPGDTGRVGTFWACLGGRMRERAHLYTHLLGASSPASSGVVLVGLVYIGDIVRLHSDGS